MGEQNVREECQERYIVTIDFSREELMEYYHKIKKHKTNKADVNETSAIW